MAELERRLHRLPTKRWWLVHWTLAVLIFGVLVVFGEDIRAAFGL